MYELTFISNSVRKQLFDLIESQKSNKGVYKKAQLALEGLRQNPRLPKPGDKEPLNGNRRGTWSIRITPRWRLIYTIHDRDLIVVGMEVVDYH